MKNMYEYISESFVLDSEILTENNFGMQQLYESLFILDCGKTINECMEIDEGVGDFFRKLAKGGDKVDAAIAKGKEALVKAKEATVKKFKEWGEEAKKAYANIKKWAGEKWSDIKKSVNLIIGKIEAMWDKVKGAMTSILKTTAKVVGTVVMSPVIIMVELTKLLIQLSQKAADKATEYWNDAKKFGALCMMYIGIATPHKAGIEKEIVTTKVEEIYSESSEEKAA